MSDKERLKQIKEFIKTHGHTLLHYSDVMFLISLAEKVAK